MSSAVPGKIIVEEFSLINNPNEKNRSINDVWSLVSGLYLYENIFSENMHGFAKILDSFGLYSNLPITASTYVKIKLKCPTSGKVVSGLYKIYKITDIKQESEALQSYTIHFISTEMFNCRKFRVSEKITGNLPKKILEYHNTFSSKRLNITDEATSTTLYFPNINPMEAIRLMVENMKWRGSLNDYCYWETFEAYYCKSLAQCLLDSPIHKLQTDYKMHYTSTEDFGYNDLIRISDISIKKNFDAIESLYLGYDGATVCTYDPITGTAYHEGVGGEALSRLFIYPTRCMDFLSITRRMQLLRTLMNTYYYVSVPGLLMRKTGDLCDVNIETKGTKGVKNLVLSGRRMICGIVHCIDKLCNYSQNITLGDYYISSES